MQHRARTDARRLLTAVFGPLDHLWPRLTEGEPDDHAAFDAHADRLTAVHLQVTAVMVVALALVAWPSDYLVFPAGSAMRTAILTWRTALVLICLTGYAALRLHWRVPAVAVGVAAYVAVMGASGFLMSQVGGIESPLFYGIYTAPLMTVMLVVDWWPRVFALASVVVAFFVTYFGAHPGHLDHPQVGTPFVWVAASSATAAVVGQVVTHLLRANFVQRRILDRRTRSLEELDRVKNEFFANVNHELRTPLTNIVGALRSISRAEAAPETVRAAQAGMRAAGRLVQLVEDLLALTRLDSGRATLARRVVDVGALLRAIAEEFQGEAPERLRLRLPAAPDAGYALVDPKQIRTVVYNLLGNAFKYGQPDGHPIELSLVSTPESLAIGVTDRGPGIARADHERIFERFRRLASGEHQDTGGAGMGLALVREITRAHGGRVELASAPGEGASFTVHVPRGDVAGQTPVAADAPPPPPPLRAAPAPPDAAAPAPEDPALPLVLVAEDDADLRAYLAAVVGRRFRVRVASDGREALAAARQEPPDLVLTDVMMPRMSGRELLTALRGEPALARVPVVFLTALTRPELRAAALREGVSDYVQKPFDEEELLARVANLLRIRELTTDLERRVDAQTRELRQLAANLSSVQEEERQRLARELHDELGQVLTGLQMELDWLKRGLGEGAKPPEALREGVQRAGSLLDEVNEAVDRVVAALRPTVLDRRGLHAALESLVADLEARHGVAGTVAFDVDEERLDEQRVVAAFRIVQEALTNVARHARAAAVEVGVAERGADCVITVRDDGVGFDGARAAPAGHFGLLGVRERARMLGGGCVVRSTPGAGTEIEAAFPFAPPPDASEAIP